MSRAFDLVDKLEEPVDRIGDFAYMLILASQSMQIRADGSAVMRLAGVIHDSALRLEEIRGELFNLLHPDPAKRPNPDALKSIRADLLSGDKDRVAEGDLAICGYEPKTLAELRQMAAAVLDSPLDTYGGHADALVRGIMNIVPAST